MGNNLIIGYKKYVKKEWKAAFISTFILCILIHMYQFTNTMPNHDSLYNVYSNQDITGSGRWFLQYVCGISSYFDLPWINGVLASCYIAMTAVVVTELFGITNPVVIVLSGGLLAASPSTTETMFFGYTADGYMIGLLMSTVAAFLTCKTCRHVYQMFAVILLCLSCAVYQAYISFAILLCACYLMNQLLEHRISVKEAWKWIGRHVIIYAVALGLYYMLWKLILMLKGIHAVSYQGIDNVGKISFMTILNGAFQSVMNIFYYLFEWNYFTHPVTTYAVLNTVFVLIFAGVLILAAVKSGVMREPSRFATLLISLLACIPLISIWEFSSDTVFYRPMMLHSICVFYIWGLILFDKWLKPKYSTLCGLLTAVIVFNCALMANISYKYLGESYERSYYIGTKLMSQIEEIVSGVEQGEKAPKQIAILGSRQQDVVISEQYPSYKIHILSSTLERDLFYDGSHAYLFLNKVLGLEIPEASAKEITALEQNPMVKQLPVWPDRDCVTVIDDTIVIRLGQ